MGHLRAAANRQNDRQMEAYRQLRILLSGMSNMLVAIISGALAPFPDMVVAGQVEAGDDLKSKIRSTQADVVMMPTVDPSRGADFEPLLHDFPVLKVVAIGADGNSGFLHELRLFSLPLSGLSAEVLIAALRSGTSRLPQ
jgi:hypothetical protein